MGKPENTTERALTSPGRGVGVGVIVGDGVIVGVDGIVTVGVGGQVGVKPGMIVGVGVTTVTVFVQSSPQYE